MQNISRRSFLAMGAAALSLVACGRVEDSFGTGGASGPQAPLPANGVRVSFVDVGKGDCILIQAGPSSALIDTGYDNTSDYVVSHLRRQGVKQLDFVIITHYDKDHVGGLRTIGETFAIGETYLPGYEGADKQYRSVMSAVGDLKLKATRVTRELPLSLGPAKLTVYPSRLTYDPYADGDEGNDNDLSLVTSLVVGKDSYLFAGDLEEEGIEAYLSQTHGTFDVLKMPHHGKKSSNLDELLDDVNPQIAIVTDGMEDPADKKTLKLLKAADVDAYCTSDCGSIIVESDGAKGYRVTMESE